VVKEGSLGTYSFLGRLVDVEESGPMDQVISKCYFWMMEKPATLFIKYKKKGERAF